MFEGIEIPNLSDVIEYQPVPDGVYVLRITKVESTGSQRTGRQGAKFVCQIVGEDTADYVIHNLWWPMAGDDARKANNMSRMIKDMVVACDLPAAGGFPITLFEGKEFKAKLKLAPVMDKDGNDTGRTRNEVSSIILD